MRVVSLLIPCLVLVVAGAAADVRAQTRPPVPIGTPSTDPDCAYALPVFPAIDRPPPPDAPDGEPGDEPAFGSVFVVLPPAGAGPVPRNVELTLGGTLAEVEQGFWDLRIEGNGGRIAFTIEGGRVTVDGGLLPPGIVTLTLSPTASHPCSGCFPPSRMTLEVTDVVDVTPPTFSQLVIHDFVPPPIDLQTRCNRFVGTGDVLQVAVTAEEDAIGFFAARHPLVEPRTVLQTGLLYGGYGAAFNVNLSPTTLVAAGDEVIVIGVARDLAGNVSPPLVTRLRVRSMLAVPDETLTVFDVPEQRCALDGAPEVQVPQRLPRNPSVRVVFPFEEQPLALQQGDELVSLVPGANVVEDARAGRLFFAPRPIDPGAWTLVNLPCTRCICPLCTVPLAETVVIDDVVDTTPPAAPIVRGLLDDADPPTAAGTCSPDRAATLAVLAPGDDDFADSHDLVYDVALRLGDDPPRPLGVGLHALRRADGDVVLRLPTAPFGRVVDAALTLEITARDTAGNTSTTTWTQGAGEPEGGCATSGEGAVVALAVLAVRRGRRRR
jgi:hypothetical protein